MGSATAPTEHEFKLQVPADYELPSLDDLCSSSETAEFDQTATYYDTPDLRLTRGGASLRFRDDDGWTVKLAHDDHSNGAIVRAEFVLGGTASSPPTIALELVAALARTARLTPVARLRTHRRRTELRTDDAPLAILTDDDVVVLQGRAPGRFRELEIELEGDDADASAADAVVARLRAGGAGDPDPTPKVVRALGPAATAPPDVVPV